MFAPKNLCIYGKIGLEWVGIGFINELELVGMVLNMLKSVGMGWNG